MILCHCNIVTHAEARSAIAQMRSASPGVPVTPGRVHKHLGVRPQCGKCSCHVVALIKEAAGRSDKTHVQPRTAR